MLKKYQKESIRILDEFCNSCNNSTIAKSFKNITKTQYLEIDGYSYNERVKFTI